MVIGSISEEIHENHYNEIWAALHGSPEAITKIILKNSDPASGSIAGGKLEQILSFWDRAKWLGGVIFTVWTLIVDTLVTGVILALIFMYFATGFLSAYLPFSRSMPKHELERESRTLSCGVKLIVTDQGYGVNLAEKTKRSTENTANKEWSVDGKVNYVTSNQLAAQLLALEKAVLDSLETSEGSRRRRQASPQATVRHFASPCVRFPQWPTKRILPDALIGSECSHVGKLAPWSRQDSHDLGSFNRGKLNLPREVEHHMWSDECIRLRSSCQTGGIGSEQSSAIYPIDLGAEPTASTRQYSFRRRLPRTLEKSASNCSTPLRRFRIKRMQVRC
uniref:Uncharacterized protein n=1 Tax=Caenorhabditis japonica TaxID=281687 RepID=A0A8R1EEQ9_CAEJA